MGIRIGSATLWANRARAGTLAGSDGAQIPFYKRYFVGGSKPCAMGSFTSEPVEPQDCRSASNQMELSTEARFGTEEMAASRSRRRQSVAGAWMSARDLDGLWGGHRYETPIGRYASTWAAAQPYEGLVTKEAEKRKWRVHFS